MHHARAFGLLFQEHDIFIYSDKSIKISSKQKYKEVLLIFCTCILFSFISDIQVKVINIPYDNQ